MEQRPDGSNKGARTCPGQGDAAVMRGFCQPQGPIGCSRSKGVMRLTCSIMLVATAILASAAVFALTRGHASAPATLRPPIPDLVELPAGTFRHRAAGEFSRNDKPVTAPLVTITIKRPLAIMRHQVTAADYQRCVEAGACLTVDQDGAVPDLPVVKVSWQDAHAYASWLS